jgi:23S rRNA pseudouridine1911/1915/1917 synthase
VNGRIAHRAASRVAAGDRVDVAIPDGAAPPRIVPAPQPLPLDILFEDEGLLAVQKPAGMVVHPTFRHPGGTLLNALLWHARDWPAGHRPSVVGRLDKATSGLVLVAKTAAVHAALQRTLASPASEKYYLAVVHGDVGPATGRIDARLRRDAADRRRVTVTAEGGLASVTLFDRLAAAHGLTLLRCRILTGRMHQIRVHLAARGWPIAGDAKYGDRSADAALRPPRMGLHAWRLAFRHPVTRAAVCIEAPVPPDLVPLLAAAGASRDML